jgi:transforming growth factor-beta-induced protein
MATRLMTRNTLLTACAIGLAAPIAGFAEAATGAAPSTTTVVATTAPPPTTQPAAGPEGPFCASIPPEGEGSFAGMADDPVATAASNNPYLTTLTAAVQAAGLVDTLNGEGPFTVFAPSNEAFAAVPPAELDAMLADVARLTDVLTYHVIAGRSLSLEELVAASPIEMANGSDLMLTLAPDGTVTINGNMATVACANIPTANATVHVIDVVLTPPDPLIDVL